MIHYQLICSQGHDFDGWFKDSAAFDRLVELRMVECPTCGDAAVRRALMAPAVRTRPSAEPAAVPASAPAPAAQPTAPVPAPGPPPAALAGPMPDHLRAMLQRLRTEVEKNCDYVGERFAEEARRMHSGDSDKRGIYGETTPEEAEALADEGISVQRIPWVPRAEG